MATLKGGNKLEGYLRAMASRVGRPATLKVGIPANATYPDGTSVALVAITNEFGKPSIGQPPRPAFRNTVDEHSGEWPGQLGKLLAANNYDATTTLGQMGELITGELREGIIKLTSPPLKPPTIRRKGSAKPLVDTGVELQSIDYEIVGGS